MKNKQANITLYDLQQGSEKVLRQVYEENRGKFLNFAKKYGLSDDDITDVYQDSYIIFYDNVMSGKIETFTSSISTYLFSIGKYLILDRLRKNKKELVSPFDLAIVREEDSIINTIEIDEPTLTTEQELLARHFNGLGKQCQELLTLFYYRGFTIKEIMQKENYNSENVVKSQKSRCMKTLRERIKANMHYDG